MIADRLASVGAVRELGVAPGDELRVFRVERQSPERFAGRGRRGEELCGEPVVVGEQPGVE